MESRRAIKTKREIIFLIDSTFTTTPGGRESWVVNVTPGLRNLGYSVTVFCRKNRQPAHFNLSPLIDIIRFQDFRSLFPDKLFRILMRASLGILRVLDMLLFVWLGYRSLKQYLRQADHPIYVIAMGTITEGLLVSLLHNQKKHPPLIVAVHGKAPWELGKILPYLSSFGYWVERKVLNQIPTVWANGYDTLRYIRERGVEAQLILNGVQYKTFASPPSEEKRIRLVPPDSSHPPVVMSIATLRKEKGIHELAAAIPLIKQYTKSPFKAYFIGGGNQAPFKAILARSNASHLAEFVGPLPALAVCYDADIMVCISGGAGISLSALEAMAAGRAIVAWDSPIYSQILKNHESALLVEEHNTSALAQAIAYLLDHPDLRVQLGQKAQEAASQYDWVVVVQQVHHSLTSIENN